MGIQCNRITNRVTHEHLVDFSQKPRSSILNNLQMFQEGFVKTSEQGECDNPDVKVPITISNSKCDTMELNLEIFLK